MKLLKLFLFERDCYFWKKYTLMFPFNFVSQNCWEFVPQFEEASPALKNSWLLAWVYQGFCQTLSSAWRLLGSLLCVRKLVFENYVCEIIFDKITWADLGYHWEFLQHQMVWLLTFQTHKKSEWFFYRN